MKSKYQKSWEYDHGMKLQNQKKVERKAGPIRSEKICTESPPGIRNDLRLGPPVDQFENSDMSDFARLCKLCVVYGSCVLKFSQIDNYIIWKRALPGHWFIVAGHQGMEVRHVKSVPFRIFTLFHRLAASFASSPNLLDAMQMGCTFYSLSWCNESKTFIFSNSLTVSNNWSTLHQKCHFKLEKSTSSHVHSPS